jgi:peptidoglycan/xylan/chitin deacetylase (PgdA/CDA1 family)
LALRRVWLAGVLVLGTGAAGAAPQYFELDRIPTQHKIVALTFDGGGDTATGTPLILSTLRRRHVTATFFVSGRWIRLHRALAREIGRRYPVGNHTYSHMDVRGLSDSELRAEIRRGAFWIRRVARRDPRPLFRFPYGARDSRTIAVANSLGYTSVRWSVDTWGWMGPSAGQSVGSVVRRLTQHLEPGAIVLMHLGAARDGSLLDAQALPRVIAVARRHGYRFVSLEGRVRAPR